MAETPCEELKMVPNPRRRVWRKEIGLFWRYPWLAFNGIGTCDFETWEEALEFALSPKVYEW